MLHVINYIINLLLVSHLKCVTYLPTERSVSVCRTVCHTDATQKVENSRLFFFFSPPLCFCFWVALSATNGKNEVLQYPLLPSRPLNLSIIIIFMTAVTEDPKHCYTAAGNLGNNTGGGQQRIWIWSLFLYKRQLLPTCVYVWWVPCFHLNTKQYW